MGRTGKVADGSGNTRPGRRQMDIFLDALAESSNVAASARAADIAANAMYRERRSKPGFAARWPEALCEGFARIEDEAVRTAERGVGKGCVRKCSTQGWPGQTKIKK